MAVTSGFLFGHFLLDRYNNSYYIIYNIIFGTYNNYYYIYSIKNNMEYNIPIAKEGYHKAILMVLNFNLNLSKMEMDIVATLLDNKISIVDGESRDIIRKVLDKDKFTTNNYISRLKDKGILVVKPADKNLYLNPSIIEIVKDKKVSFEFELI